MPQKSLHVLIFSLILILFSKLGWAGPTKATKLEATVMGPLEMISDWENFKQRLNRISTLGADNISIDVWWGVVQNKDLSKFDWTYYDSLFDLLYENYKRTGLRVTPIMSFHKAGGNVGDGDVNYPIPEAALKTVHGASFVGVKRDGEGRAYVVENNEAISPFATEAYPLYMNFMKEFAKRYAKQSEMFNKVYIGMGPAGELRFPSYNFDQGWRYPDIGTVMTHAENAKEDFRHYLKKKYKNNIGWLNWAWGTQFSSFQDQNITPPTDGDNFFFRQSEKSDGAKAYIGDYLTWHQLVLERHMEIMLKLGQKAFRDWKVQLGAKLAGIHWRYNDPDYSHAAEKAAGYINYSRFFDIAKRMNAGITMTCFEMMNDKTAPVYSGAQDLVLQIIRLSNEYDVKLNAENALAMGWEGQFKNMRTNLGYGIKESTGFSGFTYLRIGDLDNPHNADLFKNQLVGLNDTYKNIYAKNSLYEKNRADGQYKQESLGQSRTNNRTPIKTDLEKTEDFMKSIGTAPLCQGAFN